ncbi:MAG: T9SS type A sorting domain-containing protein [Bacteroidota bacterium]
MQTISISDIQGRVQKTTTHDIHNMNIEHLPQGMYILQAHREDGRIYTTKFVKE